MTDLALTLFAATGWLVSCWLAFSNTKLTDQNAMLRSIALYWQKKAVVQQSQFDMRPVGVADPGGKHRRVEIPLRGPINQNDKPK